MIADCFVKRLVKRLVKRPTIARTMKKILCLLSLLISFWGTWSLPAQAADRSPAPANAQVYIISPVDGQTVSSPFTVQFGLKNMGIAPSGVDVEYTGHHHLLVDVPELPDLTDPLASTSQILHFGAGQTETTLTLTPGDHRLQLVLGNYLHIPHNPSVVSESIVVSVE